MRAKLVVMFLVFILITAYISVEASLGEQFFGSYNSRMSPLPDFSEPSHPKIEDGDLKEIIKNTAQLAFTENRGQLENDGVRFYEQGGSVWFTDDGVWFELREYAETRSQESQTHILPHSPTPKLPHSYTPTLPHFQTPTQKYKRMILKQEFVGANRVRPVGRERLSWNSNFFYGNDSSKWCTGVPNYKEVHFENLYDGINLKYYINEKGLKYDFIVHPGADIKQIRIRYEGAEELEIDYSGNLVIKNPIRDITDCGLLIYQDLKDCQRLVEGSFVKFNNREYGFKISDEYNHQEILIIDPTVMLEYSTLVGSSASGEYGDGIAADIVGNVYITGYTYSYNFPVTPGTIDTSFGGVVDAFVFKLNSNGSELNYSTFIGGVSFDNSYDIVVDPSGNVFITGTTRSSDFPTTKGAFQETKSSVFEYDAFITKLNHNGTALLYSTYIQGGNNEAGRAIAIDSSGNAFITGETVSTNFPTTNGSYKQTNSGNADVFILKMNQTGDGLIYSTYVGGSSQDNGYGIVIDNFGNAFIAGGTRSSDFPTTEGAFNRTKTGFNSHVFVFKLNQTGAVLNYSTYVGGYNTDVGNDIAIDSMGQAIVTGITSSTDFPNTTGAFNRTFNGQYDAFIFKLNQTGTGLIFSTYIGGSRNDYSYSVDVDSASNIYITGVTGSPGFPVTKDAYDNSINSSDSYLLRMNPDGSALIYSTFIGGSNSDTGQAIALDQMGNAYVTGNTLSSDFPTTPGVYKSPSSGFYDVFVTKFSFEPLINISSISLLQENKPVTKVYSRLCPYTFRVNVIDTANITDITSVVLTLDPPTTNIQFLWDSSTGGISKHSDPIDYITIDPSSKAYNLGYLWTIDFNVIFNWNYPNENFQKIQAYATSKTFPKTWYNRSKFYCVENDLTFNGTLLVTDEENNIISENDLIRGGERLNWTGLTTVYEGTNNVFPPDEEFNVTLEDQTGLSWEVSPLPGDPFFIETIASTNTDFDGNKYKFTISEIPKHCDASNQSYILRIDGDNVTFSNESPDNSTWQTSTDVLAGVNIIDYGGGMVDGNSVEYKSSVNNGSSWSDWNSISGLTTAVTIIAQDTVTFKEGRNNLIKWRAADTVGNGPTESKQYRILVDTEDVTFSNAWPSTSDISTTDEVEVGITISDKTSGVDASSIQYAVSDNKGKTWAPWEYVEGFEDGANVVAHINLTFPNGTDNVLKWRAFDIAGNGPTESPWQMINVNIWTPLAKPRVILLSPPNGVTINKTSIEFSWELEDKTMENVTYNLFIDNETSPKFMVTDIEHTNYVIDDLKDGETYYWRVIPMLADLEGVCISGSWWFKIDLSKAEKEKIYKVKITGRDSISLFPGENKSISLSITNLGESKDTIKLELEGGKLSEYIYFEDYSILELESNNYALRNLIIELPLTIKPGNHVIMITAISMNSGEIVKDTHVIEIEIKALDDMKPDGEPNGTKDNDTMGDITKEKASGWSDEIILFIVVAIVILIILFLALALFINKRKKRAGEELLAPGTFAIKPGALPSPVITMEQVGGAPTVQQLPGPAAAGVTTQPTAVTAPVPTLAATTTATPTPPPEQIPQVPQLPQLPPAQIQTEPPVPDQITPTPTVVTPTPTIATTTPDTLESPKVSTPSPIPTVIPETQILATIPTVISTPTLAKEPTQQEPTVHLPDSNTQTTTGPTIQQSPSVVKASEEQKMGGITPTIGDKQVDPHISSQETVKDKDKNVNKEEIK